MNKPVNMSASFMRHLLSRFIPSSIGYSIFIMSALTFIPLKLLTWEHPFVLLSFVFVLFTWVARIVFGKMNSKYLDPKNSFLLNLKIDSISRHLYMLGLSSSLSWCLLSCAVIAQLGAFQKESLFVYLILIIMSTYGGPTFAHKRSVWLTFVALTMGIPALYSASMNWPENLVLSGFFCLFTVIFYNSGNTLADYTVDMVNESGQQNTQIDYFHSIIEAVPGMVAIFDQDLCYQLVNSRACSFFGYNAEYFIGKKIGFNYSGEFSELVKTFSQSPLENVQTRMQMKGNKGSRWFIVTLSRVAKDNRIVAVSLDIEDHMKTEAAAAEQRLATETSSRLAAMGELAAGIAHEINNPLAVITSKASQVIRKMEQKGQMDFMSDLEKIKTTAFRIATIVRGLKNLSRNNESDPYVPHHVHEVMRDISAVFEEKLRSHSITLITNIPETAMLECRSAQIGQVLMNLTSNAFDVLKDIPGSWIQIEAQAMEEFMEISVTDSGPGIPETMKSKLMTPFFTTKAAGVGTGLGLSISRRIATDHKGQLYLDEKSPNTRFVLKLPIKQSHTQTKSA